MKKILLIEDDDNVRELVLHILAETNAGIDTCTNGLDAMEAIDNHLYDLLITDIVMPQADGLDVLKHLRGTPNNNKTIPVIAMSGGARSISVDLSLKAAAIYGAILLKKPFRPDELRTHVHTLLNQPSVATL
jgi:CheY-like chemotaxis protein